MFILLLIDQEDCRIPRLSIPWIPTRQPIVLSEFEGHHVEPAQRRQVLTTVASWESREGSVEWDGVRYYGKGKQFERFLELPGKVRLPMELALSGKAPVERLQAAGWTIVNGYQVSRDPWVYRDYLANSFGEWSVAKDAYVRGRTGWFSCRSASYLALGVPVLVQDTGFDLPLGRGLHKFNSMEEVFAAVEVLRADYPKQVQGALEIARTYFDARKVLGELIEHAGA